MMSLFPLTSVTCAQRHATRRSHPLPVAHRYVHIHQHLGDVLVAHETVEGRVVCHRSGMGRNGDKEQQGNGEFNYLQVKFTKSTKVGNYCALSIFVELCQLKKLAPIIALLAECQGIRPCLEFFSLVY